MTFWNPWFFPKKNKQKNSTYIPTTYNTSGWIVFIHFSEELKTSISFTKKEHLNWGNWNSGFVKLVVWWAERENQVHILKLTDLFWCQQQFTQRVLRSLYVHSTFSLIHIHKSDKLSQINRWLMQWVP